MFLHTLHTWLLAHLLHPFLFFLFAFLRFENGSNIIDEGGLGFLFIFWVISFFISIPALIRASLILHPISNLRLSSYEKLVLWIIAVTMSIGINLSGILFVLDGGFLLADLLYMLPALCAAFISIIARIKPFLGLQLNHKKNNNK